MHHVLHEKDVLLPDHVRRQAVVSDTEFAMSLLHFSFDLLFHDDVDMRHAAMCLFRDVLLRRSGLRSVFVLDLASQSATGGLGNEKVDVYTNGFDRLVMDPDNKTGPSRGVVNRSVFEAFQARFVRFQAHIKSYVYAPAKAVGRVVLNCSVYRQVPYSQRPTCRGCFIKCLLW